MCVCLVSTEYRLVSLLIHYGAVNLTHISNTTVHLLLIATRQCTFTFPLQYKFKLLQSLVDLTYIYTIDRNPTLPAEKHIDIKRYIEYFKLSWKFNIDVEFGLSDVTAWMLRDPYGFHPQNNFYTTNNCTEPLPENRINKSYTTDHLRRVMF